jgi:DNA-binding transcriptional regulator GbsR (MarR family)
MPSFGSFFPELTKVSLPLVYQSKESRQKMISKVNLTDEQKQLLERLAVLYEQSGVPPAPAKILALLTVSDVTELSFDQIQDTLEISKSATSQALTQLQTFKQVEYVSRIGDRKRYFKLRTNNWLESIIEKFEHLRLTSEVYCEILKQRPSDTKDFNKALEMKAKLLRFAVDNLPGMLKDLDCGTDGS